MSEHARGSEPDAGPSTGLPFYYGWVVVAVAFVTMGIGVNTRTAFSLLFPEILKEFGWPRAQTAGIFSAGFVSTALYSPLVGVTMDRFGPRIVIPCGALLVAGGLVLSTWVTAPWELYVTLGMLVVGASVVFSYIGHSMFVPNWFYARRGLAIGIAFSGVGVGSIVLFPAVQWVIDTSGWRTACWGLAGLLVAVVLPLNAIFQRRHPSDLGLAVDGGRAGDGEKQRHAEAAAVVDARWAATDWTLGRAAMTSRFWWLSGAYFCGLFGWYAVQVHQTKYLLEIGISPELAAFALGLVGLTGIVGQIGLGHVSDRLGREWVWSLASGGFALCYVLLLLLAAVPHPALVFLMVGAQGLLGYAMASVYGVMPAELFQGRSYGTVFGVISFFACLGAGAGPWVAGALQDATGSYEPAFWVALAVSLLSVGLVWLAAPRKVRLVSGQVARRRAAPEA